jgi:hypothetical protein
VLYTQGSLSADLADYDQHDLMKLVTASTSDQSPQRMDTGDDHIEISVE